MNVCGVLIGCLGHAPVEVCYSQRESGETLLSRYFGCGLSDVSFDRERLGKPKLRRPAGRRGVEFSLSGCDRRSLVAISTVGRVGVDVERCRSIGDLERIAELYFTPAEARRISELGGAEQASAFFDCWTFKEAYTKALGTGLSTPLESFESPPPRVGSDSVSHITLSGRRWTCYRFSPWAGYAAAVVVSGHRSRSSFKIAENHGDCARGNEGC
jgi:phosphopantetheine--protein transferase-like protein